MEGEFGDSRIKNVFQIVKEIIYCWFKYNIKEENHAQMESVLDRIQNASSDLIFQIGHEPYQIVVTLHEEEVKLTIVSKVEGDVTSDPNLVTFEAASVRAKRRPENSHFSSMTVNLRGNRLIFSISYKNKTSTSKNQ